MLARPNQTQGETSMVERNSLTERWTNYRATKAVVFWACAASVVATLIVGFGWGGWVKGGTAQAMVTKAADDARAELAASICVARFTSGPDATAQLTVLKKTDSWKQDEFIEAGGWTKLPGSEKVVAGAANLCAQHLLDTSLQTKPAATSG
jgi:hypothetical protein